MALGRARRFETVNYWPGFVDALSTMLLVIIFLLSVFMLAQFFLSREVTGKDNALAKLNQQIQELTSLLAMERSAKNADEGKISYLAATLSQAQRDADRMRDEAAAGGAGADAAADKANARFRRARFAKGDHGARAGAGRHSQPADIGASQAARGDPGRA